MVTPIDPSGRLVVKPFRVEEKHRDEYHVIYMGLLLGRVIVTDDVLKSYHDAGDFRVALENLLQDIEDWLVMLPIDKAGDYISWIDDNLLGGCDVSRHSLPDGREVRISAHS